MQISNKVITKCSRVVCQVATNQSQLVKMTLKFSFFYKDPKIWNPKFHVDDLMKYQTFLLKLAGMCYVNFERFLPKRLEFVSPILNNSIFGFYSFVHIHLALLFLRDIFLSSSSFEMITNAITMFIINTFAFITLLYYKLSYKKYLKMVDYMNKNFMPRSAYGLTFITAERSYIVANRYTFWWTVMCVAGTVQWIFTPMFASKRTLPIPNLKYSLVDEMVIGHFSHFPRVMRTHNVII